MSKENQDKKVVVYDENGNVYAEFVGCAEASRVLGKNLSSIYFYLRTPGRYRQIDVHGKKINLAFTTEGKFIKHEKPKAKKLTAEEEDAFRRKHDLNPYGAWRNDEWINAMIARVDKQLEDAFPARYKLVKEGKAKLINKTSDFEWVNIDQDTRHMPY